MIHLAQRMSRLGTETAFEVLARARALEALAPSGPEGVAFLLRAGLSLRTIVLSFSGAPPARAGGAGALEPVGFGAPLSGWAAEVARELGSELAEVARLENPELALAIAALAPPVTGAPDRAAAT